MNFPGVRFLFLVTVVAAVLVGVPVDASALTPAQTKAKVAALKKRLYALPSHRGPFSIILSLTTKLAQLDPRESSTYLMNAMRRISIANAKKNAAVLTNAVNRKVSASDLSPSLKRAAINRNKVLLKKYVPPTLPPGDYQSMRDGRSDERLSFPV